MKKQWTAAVVFGLLAFTGCSQPETPQSPETSTAPATAQVPAGASATFSNKVWAVAESEQVELGSLRVFLSDGTLVMASPNATPAFGTWSYKDERLRITEEGLKYDVDILELSENVFRIRMHSPGEPVEIRFEPAEQTTVARASVAGDGWTELSREAASPATVVRITGTVHHLELEGGLFVIRDADGTQYNPLNLPEAFQVNGLPIEAEARRRDDTASIGMVGPIVELLRIRKQAGAETKPAARQRSDARVQTAALSGTAWRLENLAGASALKDVQATLEFPTEGRASGSGSCNRYNGVVTIDGNMITFGGIAATRMACAEAVMKQEDAYFAALRDAERFESDEQTLSIYVTGRSEPLRFSAGQAPAKPSANAITRAPAAGSAALTGIWTVVGHHMPGVSALSDDAAKARYGETVRLTSRAATSPAGHCGEPTYATNRVAAAPYLASEFKLARGSLKPLAAKDQINVMKVSCGGTPWTAFGGLLLQIDGDRVLTPWDGVFFELKRDRDFRGVGQEPGWQLEIRKGAEMRFTYDYGKGTAVTPAPTARVDSSSGTRTYHARTEANDLQVVIVPVSCNDSMSGRAFPATVSVTLNGKTFRGCGEELSTPYQG